MQQCNGNKQTGVETSVLDTRGWWWLRKQRSHSPYNETSADVTFRPPNISGDNNCYWSWTSMDTGDSSYNVSSVRSTIDGIHLSKALPS